MSQLGKIRERARGIRARIVFPESGDSRIREAVSVLKRESDIEAVMTGSGSEEPRSSLAAAAAGLASGDYDAMVAGAVNSTASVIKTAIRAVGTADGTRTVSSFFLMEGDDPSMGEEGSFLFADCAVVPDPTPEKLADIASATADSARRILGWEPRLALLSFSTKGSADTKETLKVRDAAEILAGRKVPFLFDGEIQADTAIVESVALSKDPGGRIAGRANILIFPDLNSGNIAYKLVQRLGRYKAVGPVLQGFRRPVNDLSRGCSAADIVDVTYMTALQLGEDFTREEKQE